MRKDGPGQEKDGALAKALRQDHVRDYVRIQFKVAFLGGLVMLALGFYAVWTEKFVYAKWPQVPGTVESVRTYTETRRGREEQLYDFTVRYERDGTPQTLARSHFSGPPRIAKGDIVTVQIDPENPDEVRVPIGSATVFILIATLGGLALMALGSLGFRKKRARRVN